jgi:thiol:disulfide interchange protein/DsbC/DsbD-like thiol-disulfide interchange protein
MHTLIQVLRWVLPTLVLAFLASPADAQSFLQDEPIQVHASLHLDPPTPQAGKPFTAVLRLKMEPGWHTYWQFGGDSGLPTSIQWMLPEGYKAGPIFWPLPVVHPSEGDQLTYIYEKEVLLFTEITPPPVSTPDTLKASVRWLACNETCIPGNAEVSVKSGAPEAALPAELLQNWRSQLPQSSPPPFSASWTRTTQAITVALGNIPADAKVELLPIPPKGTPAGHPALEPASGSVRTVRIPLENPPGDASWSALVTLQTPGAGRQGWVISESPSVSSAAAGNAVPPAAAVPSPTSVPGTAQSLPGMLLAAFLGGLLLNLMPCVLPVIALKIFGFVQQAGESPRQVFRLGLAFVAGVFCFFLLLAGLVVGFQAAGQGLTWGFQFQDSRILAGLVTLVLLFALSLFGVFEITLDSSTATSLDRLSRREGLSGAFLHGLFTTLLGTSCTAPLLGSVLGYAFTQKAPVVFAVFCTIACGMSLPYFLLTWKPAWMRFLPKPGAWMERLKQFMGFVMLAVVVWLLGVFGQSHGATGSNLLLGFLLVLALCAWCFGHTRSLLIRLILALAIAAGWKTLLLPALESKSAPAPLAVAGGIPWQPFSIDALEKARAEGQAVFVDFTADWCLNCKYNERFVLETDAVRAALKNKKVVTLKADWTNKDPEITAQLKSFGRVGVPAYVLYPLKKESPPQLLPEILTQTLLLDALGKL